MENEEEIEFIIEDEEDNELTMYSYISNHLCFEYFVGYEISSLIGYKNPKNIITNNVSKCNQLIFRDYPGVKLPELDPRTILITRDGATEILLKTRKSINSDTLHILKKFNIDMTNKKCLTKEQQTFLAITNAFKTEKFEDQYKVGKYYLDLYFPDYKIVVECDENGHADRKPYKERERMDFVNEKFEIDDSNWIRYNPDEKDFDISKVIGKIYNKIISNKIILNESIHDEINLRTCNKCYVKKNLTYKFFTQRGKGFTLTCKECNIVNGNEKPVRQYDFEGKFIKHFNSIKEASKELGVYPSQIAANCRAVRKSAGNYMWKFAEKVIINEVINIEPIKYEAAKTVAQYNTEGDLIKIYKSVGQACKELNFNTRSIYSAIKNNFVSYGFLWRYVINNEIINNIDKVTAHRKYMKEVEIYKDNVLCKSFISIKDASVCMKINISMCRKFLSGIKKDPSGLEWKLKKVKK